MALFGLTAILAVTASYVRESAFTGFHAMFRPTWTLYAYFKPPSIKTLTLYPRSPATYRRPVLGRSGISSLQGCSDLLSMGLSRNP
jgi:hypothetical protein